MAVVPKRKKSQSCRDMHRSHHALQTVNVGINKTTGARALPHHISEDGYYKGRLVIVPKMQAENTESNDEDQDS